MENIDSILNERDDIRPVFYLEKSYFELIDIKWLLLLIIVLLSIEWILRRAAGGY
jgi:hypothetical protein